MEAGYPVDDIRQILHQVVRFYQTRNMHFKVAARTMLQLGAELISSDAVAFYELIKNAFDAQSPLVEVRVVIRLPHESHEKASCRLAASRRLHPEATRGHPEFESLREQMRHDIDERLTESTQLLGEINEAESWMELSGALDRANFIEVTDCGSGMTPATLEDVYLTIGTRSRQKQRQIEKSISGRPVLGEKGLGRLSVMRLGDLVRVTTTVKGAGHWSVLEIDWRRFSHDSDELLENVQVDLTPGEGKVDPTVQGTTIRVTGLRTVWTFEALKSIALQEFSKFNDPFASESQFPVQVYYNGVAIRIPPLDSLLFEYSHAKLEAFYHVSPTLKLECQIDYSLRGKISKFEVDLSELASVSKLDVAALSSLGPFQVLLYWYNRQLLKPQLDGIGEKKIILDLQQQWSGGLKLYRDGFRVTPYGDHDDDWLQLDRRALASSGYKVNRAQLVGKVSITSRSNPNLLDQTNREGLRDSPDKTVLVLLLQNTIARFRTFLDRIDKEYKARDQPTLDDLQEIVAAQDKEISDNLATLSERNPHLHDEPAYQTLRNAQIKLRDTFAQVEQHAKSASEDRAQLVHLAGLGLMVELLAHELARTIHNTRQVLGGVLSDNTDRRLTAPLKMLEAQLKTLDKRVRVLDPLSTSGRQRKEEIDVSVLVQEVVDSHDQQFGQEGISCLVKTHEPPNRLILKFVPGMLIQIVENLLNNSAYWLRVQRVLEPEFKPEIRIDVNIKERQVELTDNGPGGSGYLTVAFCWMERL